MKKVIERIRALPFSSGMLIAVVIVVAVDQFSLGTVEKNDREAEAARAATA